MICGLLSRGYSRFASSIIILLSFYVIVDYFVSIVSFRMSLHVIKVTVEKKQKGRKAES